VTKVFSSVGRFLFALLKIIFWTAPKWVLLTLGKVVSWPFIQLYYVTRWIGYQLLEVWPSVLVLAALSPIGFFLIKGALHDMRSYGVVHPVWLLLVALFAIASVVLPISTYYVVFYAIQNEEESKFSNKDKAKSKVD